MKLRARSGHDQEVSKSLKRNWEWDQVIRNYPNLSNETGSETRWSGSVHIPRTKLGVRSGGLNVSTSLEQNWELDQVVGKCPNLSHETGSETRWSESVYIFRTITNNRRKLIQCIFISQSKEKPYKEHQWDCNSIQANIVYRMF